MLRTATQRLKRLNCPLTCLRLTCARKCLFEKGKQMNADDLICRLFSRNSVNQAQAFLGATVLLVDNNSFTLMVVVSLAEIHTATHTYSEHTFYFTTNKNSNI